MDKLYSKQALMVKAVFCVMLAPLYTLIAQLVSVEDGFLYIFLSTVPVGCLFTIPFWFSLLYLKKYRVNRIGKYILLDFFICVLPAIFGILISEIFVSIIEGKTMADGIATAIFSTIFMLISLLFWLIYFIFSRKK